MNHMEHLKKQPWSKWKSFLIKCTPASTLAPFCSWMPEPHNQHSPLVKRQFNRMLTQLGWATGKALPSQETVPPSGSEPGTHPSIDAELRMAGDFGWRMPARQKIPNWIYLCLRSRQNYLEGCPHVLSLFHHEAVDCVAMNGSITRAGSVITLHIVLAFWGCCQKLSQTQWLRKTCMISHFWRLKGWNKGVNKAIFSSGALGIICLWILVAQIPGVPCLQWHYFTLSWAFFLLCVCF